MHVIWFLSAPCLFDVTVLGFCALQQQSQMSKSEVVSKASPWEEKAALPQSNSAHFPSVPNLERNEAPLNTLPTDFRKSLALLAGT